jgi:hypothetical protein
VLPHDIKHRLLLLLLCIAGFLHGCRSARPRVRLNTPQAAALRSWIASYYAGGSSSGKCANSSRHADEAQVLLSGADGAHASGTPKKRGSTVVQGAGGDATAAS